MSGNVGVKTIARLMELAIMEGKDPTIPDIEKVIGYVRTAWSDEFTKVMGYTPGNYMRMFRLRLICQDLRNTGMSIVEICESYGRTQPYLTRDFKTQFGMTPGNYRNMGDLDAQNARDRVFKGVNFTHSFNTIPPTPKELF